MRASTLNLDNYKTINDTYGHLNGDIVLKTAIEIVSKTLPPEALISRWGGDEFIIIFPNAEKAKEPAQELVKAIDQADFVLNGISRHITISAGLAFLPNKNICTVFDDFVRVADDCLYKAKQNGRNQVVLNY